MTQEAAPAAASEPALALDVELAEAALVPPAEVRTRVHWRAVGDCDVVDAYAYLELHERIDLVGGTQRSTMDRRVMVLVDDVVGVEEAARMGARLPLAGACAARSSGSEVATFPVQHPQHPTVHVPSVTYPPAAATFLHLAESAPVASRTPVRFLMPRDVYAELETSPPSVVRHDDPKVALELQLPDRYAYPGGHLVGTGTVAPAPASARLAVSLVRAIVNGSVANAAASVRSDETVDCVQVDHLDGDPAVFGFRFSVPPEAPPTFLSSGAAIRWYVRAELRADPPSRRRWLGLPGKTTLVDYEVNVAEAPPRPVSD